MKIRKIKTLVIEIFKTVNELNSNFMISIFTSKTNSRVRPFDLLVKNRYREKYGRKSLIALWPKIWNALPKNIKKETSYSKFKEFIKSLPGPICKGKMCLSIYKLSKFIRYQRSLQTFEDIWKTTEAELQIVLIISWWMSLSYWGQPIDIHGRFINWIPVEWSTLPFVVFGNICLFFVSHHIYYIISYFISYHIL